MATTNSSATPRLHQLDTMFALAADPSALPPAPVGAESTPWLAAAEVRAEREWLGEERQRLDEFTQAQFVAIQKQREELAGQRGAIDKELIQQHQELNRQTKLIEARNGALDTRERHLADREASAAVHLDRVTRAEQELQHLRQLNDAMRQDNDAQKLLLGQLRAETAQAREELRVARAEAAHLDHSLADRIRSLDEQQAHLLAQRQLLEARLRELHRGEEALERRAAELAEVEGHAYRDTVRHPA